MTWLRGPGSCPRCRAAIQWGRRPAGESGSPGIMLQPRPVRGRVLAPGEDGGLEALDARGARVRLRLAVDGDREAWLPHDAACPVLLRMERMRAEGLTCPAHRGTCRWCAAPIFWIRTAAEGKLSPVDQVAHRGWVLTRAEVRARRGAPGIVRGFDVEGVARVIEETDQAELLGGARERATVWISHWATCPQRAAVRAHYPRG